MEPNTRPTATTLPSKPMAASDTLRWWGGRFMVFGQHSSNQCQATQAWWLRVSARGFDAAALQPCKRVVLNAVVDATLLPGHYNRGASGAMLCGKRCCDRIQNIGFQAPTQGQGRCQFVNGADTHASGVFALVSPQHPNERVSSPRMGRTLVNPIAANSIIFPPPQSYRLLKLITQCSRSSWCLAALLQR